MPGKGRRGLSKDEELNLVPVMNLVSILIPFLVMASSQMQIAVIDSTMPAIGDPQPVEETEEDDDPPLQLNVVISDQGFSVRHNKSTDEEEGASSNSEEEEEEGPEVPCTDEDGNTVSECMEVFSGNACATRRAGGEKDCVVDNYNYAGLTQYVAEVKEEFAKACPYVEGSPDYGTFDPCAPGLDEATLECDRTIIIAPEGDIPYSVLIRAMDAVREEARRGNPKEPDEVSAGARKALTDAGMDEEGITKSLGSYNPERPSDIRQDRAGSRVARKVCQQDEATGARSTAHLEIANELFPYVVIAGGTALVRSD